MLASKIRAKVCAEFQAATLAGDYATALQYQDRLMPLHMAIFAEPGVSGAKYAMSKLGLIENEVRTPLTTVSAATAALIDDAMRHAGLIN